MEKDIKHIKEEITRLKTKSTIFIAIDGRSGSGKTTFSQKLKKQIENSVIVHLDIFNLYEPELSIKKVVNEVFKSDRYLNTKCVIVESVFALTKSLRKYYDYKIWIDLPEKVGFERGLKRDVALNGIDNSDKWEKYWLPKERTYFLEDNPVGCADYVVKLD